MKRRRVPQKRRVPGTSEPRAMSEFLSTAKRLVVKIGSKVGPKSRFSGSRDSPGSLLEGSWGLLGRLGKILTKKSNNRPFQDRSWRGLGRLLDGSWADLGAQDLRRRPPSWSLLGACWRFLASPEATNWKLYLECFRDRFGVQFSWILNLILESWN